MPELPEVETTRRGIEPHIVGQQISKIDIHQSSLRWPVPVKQVQSLCGQSVRGVRRRAKYLLIDTDKGHLIIHLGMSGSLRVVPAALPRKKHDHIDIILGSGDALRFHDPRRFGCVLFSEAPEQHKLMTTLGPEPLDGDFDGDYLWRQARKRRVAIKSFIMDAKIVVGVGNIYASEALFMAGIHPLTAASKVSKTRMRSLAKAIIKVLGNAIASGGTTLRDYYGSDGNPGYFAQQLSVYGRTGEPCKQCQKPVTQRVIGQRSTFYCTDCQR
ncbi:MAG: bifunctional DNA-formamidopyrimidine glycosylase/DNA-(apurinic or apyrimidinic site) lyase [Woeseiaceae bacterium]